MLVSVPLKPRVRIVVECDGFQWHGNKDSFTADRQRDRVTQNRHDAAVAKVWKGFPDGFDPYGKDLPGLGSGGKEMIIRIRDGDVSILNAEEAEAERAKRPAKKPKTNKRGNRFL
jgi:hypothetical protein